MSNPCVLFSPIGNSDPCRASKDGVMRDGAMLHIVRYYHPEVIALFLTGEMMKYHRMDDRYRKAIHEVCPDFRDENIWIIDHGEIKDANEFEVFDQYFRKELEKLHKQYPNHEILANVTSGTPQMEACLYVLSVTLPFPIRLVQVNSPNKSSNWRDTLAPIEDALVRLKENELSTPDLDRTKEVHPQNLTRSMMTENIRSLLKSYDYQAIYAILDNSPGLFHDRVFNLCRAADCRLRLETKRAYEYAQKAGCDNTFCLHGQGELEKIYEYLLTLDILLKRKAYGDFARAVSPAITAVMEPMVSQGLGYSIHDLCRLDEKGVWRLEPKRIKEKDRVLWSYIDHSYNNSFHSSPISTDNMLKILEYCKQRGTDLYLYDFEDLREFESNIRNLAAHTIDAVTEKKIIDDCKNSPSYYLTLLRRLFDRLCPTRPAWDDYDRMNEALEKELNRK